LRDLLLIVVVGSQLDVIQQHAALAGDRLPFSHQATVVILASQPEYPFLLCFFAFQQPNDATYGDGCEDYHFVFDPFHDGRFIIKEKYAYCKTIFLSQKLYQTPKKSFPFSSIFSRPLTLTDGELLSTQIPGPHPRIYVKSGPVDLTYTR